MSSFLLKIIAIISMICDHTSDALIGYLSFFNIIGRIAFPLFCFQLVIGYKNTKSVEKYFFRLFIFALISQIPFSLFTYCFAGIFDNLNIFFTLSLGLLAMLVLDKVNNKWFAIFIDIILILLAEFIKVDYGSWGVCLILAIFVFYKDKKCNYNSNNFLAPLKNNLLFAFIFFILCIIRFIPHFKYIDSNIVILEILGTFFPIIFMLLYNGQKGPSMKYFFYAFYPLHLIVLVALHYLI